MAFFLDHMGKVVNTDQLFEAARIHSFQRRIRELREEGWPIHTHHDDDSLKPNEYRLVGDPPAPGERRKVRAISTKVRAQVFNRDGHTCQMCGAGAGEPDPVDTSRKVRLHVGHIQGRAHDGPDSLDNYRTLCSGCNEGAKDNLPEPPTWIWLLGHVRKASRDVQRKLLEWLRNRFGE